MEDSVYKIQFERMFLLEKLPADFDRSQEHLQFLANYIENTRLCLRTIRAPKTNQYTYLLEQKFPLAAADLSVWNVSRIHLNEREREAFAHRLGQTNEIRFNRYSHNIAGRAVEIEIYLGKELRGLQLARVCFASADEMRGYEQPEFAVLEVTQCKLFVGENLIGKTFADLRRGIKR